MSDTTEVPGSDAAKRIRVAVTAEDIAAGDRGNPQGCALALAFERIGFFRPWICGVGAANGRASVRGKGRARIYLPLVAQQFARDFDAKKTVQPFSFDLELK